MDQLAMIREASTGALLPQPAGDRSATATAVLVRTGPGSLSLWVSLYGGDPVLLPCQPASYVGISTVTVLVQAGRPVHVLGPAGAPKIDDSLLAAKRDAIDKPIEQLRSISGALVRPVWSGTYRSDRRAWDAWDTSFFGGRGDVYQGVQGGVQLTGCAVYGTGVTSLNAESIQRMTLSITPNGSEKGASAVLSVQAVRDGDAPSGMPNIYGNAYSTPAVAAGTTTYWELPEALKEDLRTGQARGLAFSGPQRQGVYGTSRPDGLSLTIDYTTKR